MYYYQRSTQVPNFFFDRLLTTFSEAEMKVFLMIVRQTIGWLDKRTGERKKRDRITINWFIRATGLSRRAISKALSSLSFKRLILISDYHGNILVEGEMRKGKSKLYYSINFPEHHATVTRAQKSIEPKHQTHYNKTKSYQTNSTKPRLPILAHISKFLPQMNAQKPHSETTVTKG